jgi:hypothetical protein
MNRFHEHARPERDRGREPTGLPLYAHLRCHHDSARCDEHDDYASGARGEKFAAAFAGFLRSRSDDF